MRAVETNIIHCGECSQVMRDKIPDNSIDLTVTSPPYDNLRDYNGYDFVFETIARQLWRVTKPGGVVVWVVGDATIDGSETLTSFKQAIYFKSLGFNVHDTMIYKKNGSPCPPSNRYWPVFEYMLILGKSSPKTANLIRVTATGEKRKTIGTNKRGTKKLLKYKRGNTRIKDNVWVYNAHSNNGASDNLAHKHPAIFPEALARDHIISWSNPDDIVLDPMCGSGTTLKMAVETGRQYIGIDISQEYCDLAQRRVEGARIPLPGIQNELQANGIK